MNPARTETFQHTISGLLLKREQMMDDLVVIRERMAVVSNDIEALDRVLEALGYDGDIKLTARVPRIVLFYRGELRQFLTNQLREHGPMTTRRMALNLVNLEGKDGRDHRMMCDIVRRMGKSLRQMVDVGILARTTTKVKGEFWWRLAD